NLEFHSRFAKRCSRDRGQSGAFGARGHQSEVSEGTVEASSVAKRSGRKARTSPARKRHNHELYQESVQNAPVEGSFLRRVFRHRRGVEPVRLQEDFCGTALLCCDWVKRVKEGRAYGVDLDRETLDWGIEHNLSKLTRSQRERVELAEANVLDPSR